MLLHSRRCLAQNRLRFLPAQNQLQLRSVFATTPRRNRDAPTGPTKDAPSTKDVPSGKDVPSTTDGNKNGVVSNQEQRKMDWAIMKDMVQYLWPKNDFNTRFRVSVSLGLLVGAKVGGRSHWNPPPRRPLIDSIL